LATTAIEQAIAAFNAGKKEDCLRYLDEARARQPQIPVSELMFARLCLAAGFTQEGLQSLEEVAGDHPEDPSVHLTLGQVAAAAGRQSDAQLQFSEALRLPKPVAWSDVQCRRFEADCLSELAQMAELRSAWRQARGWLERLVAIESNSVTARWRLSRAKLALGDHSGARDQLEFAVKRNDQLISSDFQLGVLFEQLRELDLARTHYEAAVASFPDKAPIRVAAARFYLDAGQVNQAKEHLAHAQTLQSSSPDVRFLCALVERNQRNHAKAEQMLSALHAEHPANVDVANQLALVLAEQPDPLKHARALELAQVNLRQFPNSSLTQATMGRVQYHLGNNREAVRWLTSAMHNQQATSDMAYYLAVSLIQLGKRHEAESLLAEAVKAPGLFVFRREAELLQKQVGNPAGALSAAAQDTTPAASNQTPAKEAP
jgi:predicted Zn-dependent protease